MAWSLKPKPPPKTDPVRPNEIKFENAPRPPLSALGEAEKAELVVTEGFNLETLSKTLSAGLTCANFLLEGFMAPDVSPELEDKGPHSTAGVWSMYVHNVSRPGRRHVRGDLMKEYRWPVDEFPSYMRGIKVHQTQVPAFRTPLTSTPLPMIENMITCSEYEQIVHCIPGFPGVDSTVYPSSFLDVHWMFHGSYLVPSAKLHLYSTPHTRANFMGTDLPSVTYEDPALATMPAFWIDPSPELYQPASCWWHTLYDEGQFSRVVPTLQDWHDWLKVNFRARWKQGRAEDQYSILACMEQPGNSFEGRQNIWISACLVVNCPLTDFSSRILHVLEDGDFWPDDTT